MGIRLKIFKVAKIGLKWLTIVRHIYCYQLWYYYSANVKSSNVNRECKMIHD